MTTTLISSPTTLVTKQGRGRPRQHAPEGRAYLLSEEITAARKSPITFAQTMAATYKIAPERLQELGKAVNIAAPLKITLHGPIGVVMAEAESLIAKYPQHTVTYQIRKQLLVPPSNALAKSADIKVIGKLKNGKDQVRSLHQEFHPYNIYIYLTFTASPQLT